MNEICFFCTCTRVCTSIIQHHHRCRWICQISRCQEPRARSFRALKSGRCWRMLEDVGSFMLKSNMSNYLGLCVWFGNVWDDGFTWIQIQMSLPRQRWEAFFGDRCCTILKLHATMSPQRNRPQDETTSFRHYSESLA